MHYKNGREAKNGDKVVMVNGEGLTFSGILYDSKALGGNYCNGRLAIISPGDPIANLADCLHAEDVAKAVHRDDNCARREIHP